MFLITLGSLNVTLIGKAETLAFLRLSFSHRWPWCSKMKTLDDGTKFGRDLFGSVHIAHGLEPLRGFLTGALETLVI